MSKLAERLKTDLSTEDARLRALYEKLADVQADIKRAKEKVEYLVNVLMEEAEDQKLVDSPPAPLSPAVPTGNGMYSSGMSMLEIVIDVLRLHGPEMKLEDIIAKARAGGFAGGGSNLVGAFSSVLSKYKHKAGAVVRSGRSRGFYRLVENGESEKEAA